MGINPFEAGMRHLINAYFQGDPAADLGELRKMSLTELVIKSVRPGSDAAKRIKVILTESLLTNCETRTMVAKSDTTTKLETATDA